MSKQSEAQRLAEWLQANYEADEIDRAADLLRKLFADEERLKRSLRTSSNSERCLRLINEELLAALVSFTKSDYIKKQHPKRYANAVAAIAKATGEQT